MKNISIINGSARVNYYSESGLACGPMGLLAVEAEMQVWHGNDIIYLHAGWVDQAPDTIIYEATEDSLWPYLFDSSEKTVRALTLLREEELESHITDLLENPESEYLEEYALLRDMIFSFMRANGWGWVLEQEDWEDEEELAVQAAKGV